MTFLNPFLLLGLAAIAIPIIIHLMNRSKPHLIEWGAMQFLRASMMARRRRVKIEDGILLCLRCLALAALSLAMARPFLPSMSAVPWVLILPGLLVAVMLAGIAAVLWPNELLRRRLLKIAGICLVVAIAATLLEQRIQARRWMTAAGGRDTVVILDASLSMTLTTEGLSHFGRAVKEARELIEKSGPGDSLAIVLGGAVPQALMSRPTSDRRELVRVLEGPDCKPAGGSMATLEALYLASTLLAEGPNASKTIVIFTDGQNVGWDAQTESRWNFLAASFKQLPTPPRIICRRLPSPDLFRNTLVSGIRLSRSIIGTDRPVKLDVTIGNSGTVPVHPTALEVLVNGQLIEQVPIVKDLVPQATEGFVFNHLFITSGPQVVQARLVAEDDLPGDNSLTQTVSVLDRLPVLLVEGASAERFFFRKTASLIRIALTPRDAKAGTDPALPEVPFLVKPTIVEAAEIGTIKDLNQYRVMIMADVSRLPAGEAERVSAFVKAGGGLLITPGARAEPAFYNAWQTSAGETILPARLLERAYPPDPLKLDLKSLSHPALQLIAKPDQSDARLGLVAGYWKLGLDPASVEVRVGGRLESGAPWLLERPLGKGCILMTPQSFDRRDSNLSSLKCYVPLIHEMVYFLAAASLQDFKLAARNPLEESSLTSLSEADIAAVRSHVDLFLPKTMDELLSAFTGKIPGQELWKILVLCALLILLAEGALTRWITLHRHLHQAQPVVLKSPAQSVEALKERLTELIAK